MIALSIVMPSYPQDMSAPPPPQTFPPNGVATTETFKQAVQVAQAQVGQSLNQVEQQMEAWLTQQRHEIALYREALARAVAAHERDRAK